jgi:hypothetical protein
MKQHKKIRCACPMLSLEKENSEFSFLLKKEPEGLYCYASFILMALPARIPLLVK